MTVLWSRLVQDGFLCESIFFQGFSRFLPHEVFPCYHVLRLLISEKYIRFFPDIFKTVSSKHPSLKVL